MENRISPSDQSPSPPIASSNHQPKKRVIFIVSGILILSILSLGFYRIFVYPNDMKQRLAAYEERINLNDEISQQLEVVKVSVPLLKEANSDFDLDSFCMKRTQNKTCIRDNLPINKLKLLRDDLNIELKYITDINARNNPDLNPTITPNVITPAPELETAINQSKVSYLTQGYVIDSRTKKYSSNYFEVSFIPTQPGSGFVAALIYENGIWSKLWSGQDRPLCSLLESHHVPSGVRCVDPTVTGINGINDPLYRVTKD